MRHHWGILSTKYCPSGISPRNIQETITKGWDTTGALYGKQKIAPVVSHPKTFEKQSTKSETPLGHYFADRKSPQRCLTPNHSRNSQEKERQHRIHCIQRIQHTAYTAYTAYDIQRIDRIQCVQRMQRIQRIQHVQRIQHMQEHRMQRIQHIQNVRRIRAPHSVYSMYTSHICYIQHKHHCATQASRGPPLRPNCAENLYITMVLLIFRFATTNWTCCCCCCCCLSWDCVTPDSLL